MVKRVGKRRLPLLLLSLLFLPLQFLFAEPFALTGFEAGAVNLSPELEILEDHGGDLQLEEVINAYRQGRFIPSNASTPNFGFTDSVYWARLAIQNNSNRSELLLQIGYPLLDYIDLYRSPLTAGEWEHSRSGDHQPYNERVIAHRTFIFPATILENSSRVFYWRFQSEGALEFPVYLHSPETLRKVESKERFSMGMFYGFILIMAVYNLLLYFIVRDRSYLYYFFYITGYGMLQMTLNGLAYEYFWSDSSGWINNSLTFFIGWSFFWATLFASNYLHANQFTPLLYRLHKLLLVALVVLMALSPVIPYRHSIKMSAVLVVLFSVVVLITSARCLKKGYAPAGYFLLAWFTLLLGVILYALKGYGFLPTNFITTYGLQLGAVLEMSLLSMGLANRIKVSSLEKEKAERRMLATRRLKERAQIHATRLEIELLKKNIQPHFLLNTINAALVWLEEEPRNTATLLRALADELRLLQDFANRKMVTISEEIQLCQIHLKLMSLRHDNEYELIIDEHVNGDDKLPPLILHTLIENGLTHGFKDQDSGFFKLIIDHSENGVVSYTLENNGSPLESRSQSAGLGLRYVKTRLEEVFPGRWKLTSRPLEQSGWQVTIEITPRSPGSNLGGKHSENINS